MQNKKLIVLIMAGSNPYYRKIENSIRETWFNLKNKDVEIFFYSDSEVALRKKSVYLEGDTIMVPCQDGFHTLGFKTLCAFEWISKNYSFDYIYRSNLGAMVYPDRIIRFLDGKPKEKFYCGIVGKDTFYLGREVEFASGSGYFLSADIVYDVLKNHHLWQHNVVDDVALGYIIESLGIKINESAMRKSLCDDNIEYQIGRKSVDYIPDEDLYHIRLRSDDREKDIKNMIELYKKNNYEND